MRTLKAKYLGMYKKRNQKSGEILSVFKYTLDGKEETLKQYEEILEKQDIPVYRDEDSGKIIYFDTVFHGENCIVGITNFDKIIVENDELDKLQSQLRTIANPELKRALADKIAEHLMNGLVGGRTQQAANMGAQTVMADEEEADLDGE